MLGRQIVYWTQPAYLGVWVRVSGSGRLNAGARIRVLKANCPWPGIVERLATRVRAWVPGRKDPGLGVLSQNGLRDLAGTFGYLAAGIRV